MSATTTLRFTSSTEADNRLRMARVLAAGRAAAERQAREARQAREQAQFERLAADGQFIFEDGTEWCSICSRATDHWGEHSPEQIAAWREGRQ